MHPTRKRSQRESSDAELINAAKAGDRRAFSELVRRYEGTVYRFAFKLCRDKEKASETFQDTFINVYRKLASFDGRSKFSTWLYSIVANNCLMKNRKRRMQELEDPLEVLDNPLTAPDGRFATRIARWPQTPDDLVLSKELATVLETAIRKLSEDYRAVFVLRDIEERSTAEAAQVLNISIEAVKSRLRRARAFLRNELAPYMAHQEFVP